MMLAGKVIISISLLHSRRALLEFSLEQGTPFALMAKSAAR